MRSTTLAPATAPLAERVTRQVEIEIKYEGYIQRQLQEIDKFRHLEQIKLPEAIDYGSVHGLSSELKEKLAAVRPASLGQASRIEGMTPAAISVLMVHLRTMEEQMIPRLRVDGLRIHDVGPVSLEVDTGTCVGLSGPSGAGKTLLLRAIADMEPHEGKVYLDGTEQSSIPAPEWRRLVSLLPAESMWWLDSVGAAFHTGRWQRL